MAEARKELKTLFVGNLGPEITSSKIKEMFGSQV
jgi:RNA recognition motif-containing protein